MKYTKSILALLVLNFFLAFSMIYVANKTREIEKNNSSLKSEISKINETIKINKIELLTYQNSSYLNKLYSLYFDEVKQNENPNLLSIRQLLKKGRSIELVNSSR